MHKIKLEEKQNAKRKICPIMAMGSEFVDSVNQRFAKVEKLPKCLRENCALWIAESFAGSLHGEEHCGLKN